eukprot:4249057-Prymnesium_polylepis.1
MRLSSSGRGRGGRRNVSGFSHYSDSQRDLSAFPRADRASAVSRSRADARIFLPGRARRRGGPPFFFRHR